MGSRAAAALAAGAVLTLGAVPGALAAKTQTVSMNGRSEIPRGDPDGHGTARITLDRARGRVCFSIRLTKVGTVAAGHIHKGARGKAGPVVVTLFTKPTRQPKGCARGVSKALIRDIERNPGRYYVNVHNKRFPGGAVRGQMHR